MSSVGSARVSRVAACRLEHGQDLVAQRRELLPPDDLAAAALGQRGIHVERRRDPAGPRRHDRHLAAEQQGLLHVVRDEHDRPRLIVERAAQPLLQVAAGDRVESTERFVEQQDLLAGDKRPQERHALAHSPRQLTRQLFLELSQAEARHHRGDLAPRRGAAHAAVLQRERRVAEHVPPRQQQVALRHPGATPQPLRRGRRVEHLDRAAGRLVETADHVQQRRLAAAARADDRQAPVQRDRKVDTGDRLDRSESLGHTA